MIAGLNPAHQMRQKPFFTTAIQCKLGRQKRRKKIVLSCVFTLWAK